VAVAAGALVLGSSVYAALHYMDYAYTGEEILSKEAIFSSEEGVFFTWFVSPWDARTT